MTPTNDKTPLLPANASVTPRRTERWLYLKGLLVVGLIGYLVIWILKDCFTPPTHSPPTEISTGCRSTPEYGWDPDPSSWDILPDDIDTVDVEVTGMTTGTIHIATSTSRSIIETHFKLSHPDLIPSISVTTNTTSRTFKIRIETPKHGQNDDCIQTSVRIIFLASLQKKMDLRIFGENASIDGGEMNRVAFENVELKTVNGRIKLRRTFSADSISLKTTNGAIEGTVLPTTHLSSNTTNGAISLTIPPSPRADRPYSVSAQTTNGRIGLVLPDSFSGRFDAAATVGRVDVRGRDLHYERGSKKPGFPGMGGRKTGWKGSEDGPQDVGAVTVSGAVEIDFEG